MSRQAVRPSLASILKAGAIPLALVIQVAYLATGGVGRQVERAWSSRHAPAIERSAQIAFGDRFSGFIGFLREVVPESARLVVPSKGLDPLYGDIGLMQYFLRPREIIDCPMGEGLLPCVRSLTGSATYILSGPHFPPPAEAGAHRTLLAFDDKLGVYVPAEGGTGEAPGAGWVEEIEAPLPTVWTIVLDFLLVGGLGGLGLLLARSVLKGADRVLLAAVSVPLGQAVMTWVLFLVSWAGLQLTLTTIAGTGALLAIAIAALARGLRRKGIARRPEGEASAAGGPRSATLGWTVWGILVGVGLLVSVMRSYSTWDDMSAYAIRGYGIAREGGVSESLAWGPVAASYPLNVPLAISLFHFLDGDILPGSKLLFPFYLGAIVLIGYRLWRQAGHTDGRAAALSLALGTIPLVFDHSTTGYTNLPFAVCLALGCVLVLEGMVLRDTGKQWVGGMFLAGALWTRPEGILVVWGLVVVLLTLSVWMRRGMARAGVLLAPAWVSISWFAYSARLGPGNMMTGAMRAVMESVARGDLHLEALYWTLRYLGRSLIDPSVWGLLLPSGLLLLAVGLRRRKPARQELAWPLLAVAAAQGIAVLVFYYLVSFTNDLQFVLGTGVERMFLPAIVLGWMGLGILAARPAGTPPPSVQAEADRDPSALSRLA